MLCSNETHAPIANPPNKAQLEDTRYHSLSYIWVRTVVWECGDGQTDTQTAVTTMHFVSATFTRNVTITYYQKALTRGRTDLFCNILSCGDFEF